ncbi:MAG: hypothetical protein ACOYM3_22395 [Terrimicrobiaceae bacterium]
MTRVDRPRLVFFRIDWKSPFSHSTEMTLVFGMNLADEIPDGSISPARNKAEITASGIPPGAYPCGVGMDFFRSLGMSGGRSPAVKRRAAQSADSLVTLTSAPDLPL